MSLVNSYLLLKDKEIETKLYIPQIRDLILETDNCNITVSLLNELVNNNVNVIICNNKKNPNSFVVGINKNCDTAKNTILQAHWDSITRNKIWMKILKNKIRNQLELLNIFDLSNQKEIYNLLTRLDDEDESNIEGQVARLYFHALFGKNFNRREECDINSALNYGYSIILSSINRSLTLHGYQTALGIHHNNNANYFNLSYDIIEPFRAFVDEIVFNNKTMSFDKDYKMTLVQVLNKSVCFDNKEYVLADTIDEYVLSVMRCMKDSNEVFKEISHAR